MKDVLFMLNRIELKRGAKALTKSARVSAYRITLNSGPLWSAACTVCVSAGANSARPERKRRCTLQLRCLARKVRVRWRASAAAASS